MGLSFRHGRIDDLPRVHALARTGSRDMYDADTLRLLLPVWRTWLSEKRAELHLFIDDALPPAEQVHGMALGAFVTDAFADELIARPMPGVAQRVVRLEHEGKSVVLTPDEVARANTHGGLNALGLDYAFAGSFTALTPVRWSAVLFDSLRAWGEGWRLRFAIREWIGTDLATLARASGWPLVHDFGKGATKKPPALRRRYLSALSRKQHLRFAARMPAALFFNYREPQFSFTPAEQQLLMLAIRNVSDADAATQLELSPHTVKARWKAILQQVGDAKPDWFPTRDEDPESAKRGVEKRRHLLAWLQKHVEELRPRVAR